MSSGADSEGGVDHLMWYPGHDVMIDTVVSARNSSVFDADGNRYVDLESGVWCTPLGHGHPRILSVLAEQSARIMHCGYNYVSPVVGEAAAAILELLGFQGGKCVFLASGSEAIEYGVRLARSVTGRNGRKPSRMLTMHDSYFGAYGSAAERDDDGWVEFDWSPCAECPFAGPSESAQSHEAPTDSGSAIPCTEECPHWKSIPIDEIDGFLFEPGSSSGLVRFPPQRLISSIVGAVRSRNGVVIVNEVTTGIGRTGAWFGYQHYGISPDIVALGKGIGNGYPVSVCAVAPQIAARAGDTPIHYAQSHQNDPLGAAIAREVIAVIRDEKLIDRARMIGTLLANGLEAIRGRVPGITDIRSRGLMIAVELDGETAPSFTTRVHRALLENGYIVARRPGLDVLRIDPPLTIEETDIRGFLETLEELLHTGGNSVG